MAMYNVIMDKWVISYRQKFLEVGLQGQRVCASEISVDFA